MFAIFGWTIDRDLDRSCAQSAGTVSSINGNKLNDPNQVYEIQLDANEKPLTVRQRLLKVAQESGKEIVDRKYGNGFAIGLMTPERRSRRGRKPKSAG